MDLSGKVAIVTGAAVRLGKAIALGLAQSGCRIAVHYGNSAEAAQQCVQEINSLGIDCIAIQADFNAPVSAAQHVVQETIAHFGTADILINNAAIFESSRFGSTTEELWDSHFDINLKTPYFLSSEFANAISAGQPGHIINIVDWRATRPDVNFLPYSLTKSALLTLTRGLAQQLAPNIQVNAIAPGAILPPPGASADYLEQLAENIPLAKVGSAAEIVASVLFLLQSEFITGEILNVSGGQHL